MHVKQILLYAQTKKSTNYTDKFGYVITKISRFYTMYVGVNKYVYLAEHNGMGDKVWWILSRVHYNK